MVYDEFKTFQINQLSVPLLDINMLYMYICMNYFCIFLFQVPSIFPLKASQCRIFPSTPTPLPQLCHESIN